MATVQITLPDQLASQAQAAGLLAPEALERMLRDALERLEAVDRLFEAMDRAEAAGFPEMSLEEIQVEVEAVRAKRSPPRATVAGNADGKKRSTHMRLGA